MRACKILAAVALSLATVTACAGKHEDEGADTAALCKRSCETTASLMCARADTCVADCKELLDTSKLTVPEECGDQVDAAARCYSALPASEWECQSDGTPLPKATACPNETMAILSCASG